MEKKYHIQDCLDGQILHIHNWTRCNLNNTWIKAKQNINDSYSKQTVSINRIRHTYVELKVLVARTNISLTLFARPVGN